MRDLPLQLNEILLWTFLLLLGAIGKDLFKGFTLGEFERIAERFRYRFFGKKGIIDGCEGVKIGEFDLPIFLIDGNGEECYRHDTIVAIYAGGSPECDDFIEDKIIQVEKEMEQKRLSGDLRIWNGNGVGLRSYNITRGAQDECLGINIRFYKSTYAEFVATVLAIGIEPKDEKNGFRARYLTSLPEDKLVPELARHVGVAALVITSDHKVILTRRSSSTRARPGSLDVSVVEGIEPIKDGDTNRSPNRIDIYNTFARGCEEELGFRPSHTEIEILGFGVDTDWYQFNFIGIVYSRETFQYISRGCPIKAKDRWESGQIFGAELDLERGLEMINLNRNAWSFFHILLYFYLIKQYGRDAVDDRACKIVRKI